MSKKAAKQEGPSFEEAMERLEAVAEEMQSSDLPLEGIIERYEEGMKLLEVCGQKLKAAEKKIELLTREKSGKVTASDWDDKSDQSDGDEGESTGGGSREVSLF